MLSATTKRTILSAFTLLFLLAVFLTAVPKANASTDVSDIPGISGCTAEEASEILDHSSLYIFYEKLISIDDLLSEKSENAVAITEQNGHELPREIVSGLNHS